ncbi:hypothetical protein EXD76_05740 [BEV proteobacterium]|nr:hypothetical protein [Candidatus Symbiopectobacterium sp. Chty_BC]
MGTVVTSSDLFNKAGQIVRACHQLIAHLTTQLHKKYPSEMNPTLFHEELRHHLMSIVYKMHNLDYAIL